MKTLNNNKIKHKFSKTNLIAHNQAFSHKGLKLATDQQSTKAKATIRNTKHNPFSQTTKILTFGQCPSQNTAIPSQNSTLLYHHKIYNILIILELSRTVFLFPLAFLFSLFCFHTSAKRTVLAP